MDLNQAYNNSLSLEPRLQEFIKKKRFYKQNSIKPSIPLEQQFNISNTDKVIIKRFLKGSKNVYDSNVINNPLITDKFIKPSMDTSCFTNDNPANDPRMNRLKKKMASHKKARDGRSNYSNMDSCYSSFKLSNPYDNSYNASNNSGSREQYYHDKPTRSNLAPRMTIDKPYENTYLIDSNNLSDNNPHRYSPNSNNFDDYTNSNSNSNNNRSQSSYHHTPSISYRNPVISSVNGNNNNHDGLYNDPNTQPFISDMDNYNKYLEKSYSYIDGNNSDNNNNFVPHHKYKNIDISAARRGEFRDSRKKSLGMDTAFEHSFQFIDKNISDPNHTVQMWPENTRGSNKQIAGKR